MQTRTYAFDRDPRLVALDREIVALRASRAAAASDEELQAIEDKIEAVRRARRKLTRNVRHFEDTRRPSRRKVADR